MYLCSAIKLYVLKFWNVSMSSGEILACPRDLTCLLPTYEVKPSVYRGHFLRKPPPPLRIAMRQKRQYENSHLHFCSCCSSEIAHGGGILLLQAEKGQGYKTGEGAKKSIKYNQFDKRKVPGNSGHCIFSSLIEIHFREISLPPPPFPFLSTKVHC